jgi:hypothetical protein
MKTLRVGSVMRISVMAVLAAFVITPNTANASKYRPPAIHSITPWGKKPLLHQCKAFPKEKGCLPAASWCEGWDEVQKCCYQWHCGFVS